MCMGMGMWMVVWSHVICAMRSMCAIVWVWVYDRYMCDATRACICNNPIFSYPRFSACDRNIHFIHRRTMCILSGFFLCCSLSASSKGVFSSDSSFTVASVAPTLPSIKSMLLAV